MSALDFLSSLWGADEEGVLSQVHIIDEKTPGGMKHHPVYSVAEAVDKAESISASGRDAYFACAQFKTDANRMARNASGAHCFWLDVDCGAAKAAEKAGYETRRRLVTL